MLQLALGKPSFGELNLVHPMTVRDGFDAAIATILGISGFLLILAAIGYLADHAGPRRRAGPDHRHLPDRGGRPGGRRHPGLVLEGAALVPGRADDGPAVRAHLRDRHQADRGRDLRQGDSALPAAVGQAVIGTVLVIIGAFAPLVLFRLLAFVDPGTSSGQSFRASLDAAGGVAGLLGGRGQGAAGRAVERRQRRRHRHQRRRVQLSG